MKENWVKKSLVVSIILLFIGVTIAPSINFIVVKASNDNNLFKVTSQACGIQGFGDTTVKLTKEQYQNLEQYLVEFRARLNQTTTSVEAVPIFKDAVVELDKYRLLPNGISIEQGQRLVTDESNSKINMYKSKLFYKFGKAMGITSNFYNAFCLLYMRANRNNGILEEGLLQTIGIALIVIAPEIFLSGHWTLAALYFFLGFILGIISMPSILYNKISPLKLWVMIYVDYPEIWSWGMMGYHHATYQYAPVYGFKGLRISSQNTSEVDYIGQALMY